MKKSLITFAGSLTLLHITQAANISEETDIINGQGSNSGIEEHLFI